MVGGQFPRNLNRSYFFFFSTDQGAIHIMAQAAMKFPLTIIFCSMTLPLSVVCSAVAVENSISSNPDTSKVNFGHHLFFLTERIHIWNIVYRYVQCSFEKEWVCGWYIEDITWPRGDTKFLFECWKIFHSFAALTREIFSTREEKFRISKRPCNVLFII